MEAGAVTTLSATEIAARVASGDLSAADVVEAHTQRIDEVDGRLNAVVARRFAAAREEAKAVDAARSRGEPLGPLAGVPITIKDQFDVAGMATTYGLNTRRNHVAGRDGPLVGRLREAGAIVLGKTNVSQLLFFPEGDNPLFGRTANPWDLQRTPGGGSAGEAAIIAAGGSTLGLASDIGGSIRNPAHFCGIQGLRPTSRRLTILDSPPEFFFPGFTEVALDAGTLARHVEDLTLAMKVLAAPGQERIDPRVPPVPWRDPADVDVAGLRVAMIDDDAYFGCAPAMRRAVREAADGLRRRGADVERFAVPQPEAAMRIYLSFLGAGGLEWAKPLLQGNPVDRRVRTSMQMDRIPDALRPALGALLSVLGQRRMARTITTMQHRSTTAFWAIAFERDRWRRQFMAALDDGGFEAILAPGHTVPAMRHGASGFLLPDATNVHVIYNVVGLPAGLVAATRVRAGEESDRPRTLDVVERTARKTEEGSAGLPVGVQVAARHWREDVVLAVMGALEDHFRKRADYPEDPPC